MVCDTKHFEENDAVPLIIRAGQMSFDDVYMILGSQTNRTDKRRATFIIRLMPASSFYDHELGVEIGEKLSMQGYGERLLYLVSGADKSGTNFKIGHFWLEVCQRINDPWWLEDERKKNGDLSCSPFMITF